jgi:endonuclease/exonuclease/phosphatase family metal-dependent hydrolase
LVIFCHRAAADELFLAYWNVENLFDTIDDPAVEGDEEFTPTAPKKWTEERLQIKLKNLARVLSDANDGKGPDVLGLAEIENRETVKLLVQHLSKLDRDYKIVHQDSPSGRGIDCAMIYDAKRIHLKEGRFLAIPQLKTRDIVEGVFEFQDSTVHIFVNHWPSKGNPQSARVAAATILRKRIENLLAVDEMSEIVVIGDLNEMPYEPAVAKTLKTWSDPKSLHPKVLFNSTWKMHEADAEGTYVYRNKWEVIDHVILSQGLLDERGLRWKPESTKTMKHEYQMFHPRTGIPRPSRSYSGNSFHDDGFSDHLPIRCVLEMVKTKP